MNKTISTLSVLGILAASAFALEGCNVEYRHDHGHWRRPSHGHGHGRRGRGGHHWVADAVASTEALNLAQSYDISLASAHTILALASGESQQELLAALGLEINDVSALASLEMPSRERVEKVANALGEDRTKIERLMIHFIEDIQAEDALDQSSSDE